MKWICPLSLLLLLFSCSKAASQPDHLASLRAKYAVAFNVDGCDFGEPTFLDYVINRILPDTTYKKYITDRTLLRKLKTTTCLDDLVRVNDRLDDGRLVKITLRTAPLDTNRHTVQLGLDDRNHIVEYVDGRTPYGADYWHDNYSPDRFDEIEISIADKALAIPEKAFSNLYEPNLCFLNGWTRPLEVYAEKSRIYIYLVGGNAATTYFAKIIFDNDQYVTTLVADYGPLPCYGSFRPDFPGF